MFNSTPDTSTNHIAIDPGTSQTRMYAIDAGLLFNEPSLGAQDKNEAESGASAVKAWGEDALELVSGEPDRYVLVRASNIDPSTGNAMNAPMLRYFLRKIRRNGLIASNFRTMLALPSGFGNAEIDRLINTCRVSGASKILIADRAAASSIGAQIERTNFDNPVLVDIGASGTELCGYSAGELVFHRQLPIGGDALDQALKAGMQNEYDMLIHEGAAREIKHRIGAASLQEDQPAKAASCQLVGRDAVSGRIRNFRVGSDTVHQMLLPSLNELLDSINEACMSLPAALGESLHRNGLRLTGGGAMLLNLADTLATALQVPVAATERPLTATVRGAAVMLQQTSARTHSAASDTQKMVG